MLNTSSKLNVSFCLLPFYILVFVCSIENTETRNVDDYDTGFIILLK